MGKIFAVALLLLAAACPARVLALAGGDPDPSFAYPNPARGVMDSTNAVPLPDGSFIVITSLLAQPPAAAATLDLAHFDANGVPLPGFGRPDGRVRLNLPLRLNLSLAAIRDGGGGLLLGGQEVPPDTGVRRKAAIARIDASGMLDTSFGTDGFALYDIAPGEEDRVEQLALLPDGRLLASVNAQKLQAADVACWRDITLLLRFDVAGREPAILNSLDDVSPSDVCSSPSTLHVLPDGEILFGNHFGIRALPGPDHGTAISLPNPDGATRNPGAFLPGMIATYVDHGYMRLYYDDRNEPNRGLWMQHPSPVNPPWLPLGFLARLGFGQKLNLLVSDSAGYYVGFGEDTQAGVARFDGNGTVRTDWGGGDGVVAVYASDIYEGAGDVRQLFVQPNGDVIVVTASGFIRKLSGAAGVAHGGFALERQSYGVSESDATYTLRVARTGGSAGPASVKYSVTSTCDPPDPGCPTGTYTAATAGEDFEAASGEFFWDDGDSDEKVIQVRVKDDPTPEFVEYFFVRLTQPTGGVMVLAGTTPFPINQSDQPTPPPPSPPGGGSGGVSGRSGGGAAGFVMLALVSLLTKRKLGTRAGLVQ